jgi:hypothetical protein
MQTPQVPIFMEKCVRYWLVVRSKQFPSILFFFFHKKFISTMNMSLVEKMEAMAIIDKGKGLREQHWKEIGRKGLEMRHDDGSGDWAGVVAFFPPCFQGLLPARANTIATRLTEKVKRGDIYYRMNGMQPPNIGWFNDRELFWWCCVQLETKVPLTKDSVRAALKRICMDYKAGPKWDAWYDRFLKRNCLCEDPARLGDQDLTQAKCLEGCRAMEERNKKEGRESCEDGCGDTISADSLVGGHKTGVRGTGGHVKVCLQYH